MTAGRPVPSLRLAGAVLALWSAAASSAGPDPLPVGSASGDTSVAATPATEPAPAAATAAPAAEGSSAAGAATAPPAAAADSLPAAAPAAPAQPAPTRRAELPRREPTRPSLMPLVQPLWSDLTPAQRQVLAPFSDNWNALPITEKRAWADLAQRFPAMKADEQKRVERRIAEWAALTPEQRRIARANYVLAQQVARENLLAQWEHYQSMTPEQRSVLDSVGNAASNTAARHVTGPTGLAAVAAQPLPRRTTRPPSIAVGTDGSAASSAGVAPTVGPAGGAGKR